VPDLERYLAKGRCSRHYSELYATPDGNVRPAAQLSEQFAAMESNVKPNGFSGLRASA
jgi:hypothetical protein